MRTPPRASLAAHLTSLDEGGVVRTPIPGPPPIPGAQWDEVRAVWMRWIGEEWVEVEEHIDGPTLGDPIEDVVLPAALAYDLAVAKELDLTTDEVVIDLRAPEPTVKVPGAQWNEVAGRWERWDDDARTWLQISHAIR
jgi:hypothetical protein